MCGYRPGAAGPGRLKCTFNFEEAPEPLGPPSGDVRVSPRGSPCIGIADVLNFSRSNRRVAVSPCGFKVSVALVAVGLLQVLFCEMSVQIFGPFEKLNSVARIPYVFWKHVFTRYIAQVFSPGLWLALLFS